MRFRHPSGGLIHLAYCTNVHPAETLDGVLAQLSEHCAPVRRRLGRERLGIGLWLAADVVKALSRDPKARATLTEALRREGLEVVTLNGFPYRGFGSAKVKHRVYQPDWTTDARREHTLQLACLLAGLLPDDVTEGTISTLPLAWRTPYDAAAEAAAVQQLNRLSRELDLLASGNRRQIRVALEPEPGCVIETTDQAARLLTGSEAPPTDRIGLCLDTCHLATAFEDPDEAIDRLVRQEVPIYKAQLSAALHAEHPERPEVRRALAEFVEERFLHQTRERAHDGTVTARDDLDLALDGEKPLSASGPWRVHHHIPLHAKPPAPLSTTLPVLRQSLARLVGGRRPLTRHLEVETYTWQVLPPELRPTDADQLADGIAAELSLARDLLTDLGLKEEA
ncbi:Sugar phosphate isomerase/epimerase [Streptomyces zhaozhouensis]|uniref:Sugar phosphate isomerase/epimerase n=1 Tax=Streptomyces zhaozhouensis TaxID=1300267 RepID=A0A286DPU2_9ACTN|nr:metabolite traffic protein EboE [Streptomyces zhaozhouensis]SOD60659.1 Sugar phosphate isomerase/epimerase [Streptomyces zhaozhouensis]